MDTGKAKKVEEVVDRKAALDAISALYSAQIEMIEEDDSLDI